MAPTPAKRTPPRPRKTRPRKPPLELPDPHHVGIELISIRDERPSMSGLEKCLGCTGLFELDDTALRIREYRLMVDYLIHRRCIEKVLLDGPIDDAEFESYRERLVQRYTH